VGRSDAACREVWLYSIRLCWVCYAEYRLRGNEGKMKIYLASSWKNKDTVLELAKTLRDNGHEVDAFCDEKNRISFNWSELLSIMNQEGHDIRTMDARDMLKHWRVQAAFKEDKKWIDWADVILMLMPCGRSSHLEAGYAVGSGKKLYILGGFKKGEFETMYGFAEALFDYAEINNLLKRLNKRSEK